MNRTVELLRLFNECGRIEGRKKLQKLVHILKESGNPLDYRYSFHYHGPFSAELKDEIDFLASKEVITETAASTNFAEFRQFVYTATPLLTDLLEEFQATQAPEWSEFAKALNTKSAQELEAISTIVFLIRKGSTEAEIPDQFRSLKPHLAPLFNNAIEIAKEVVTK